MAKLIIVCLGVLVGCDAGLIPSQLVYHHFPNLKTVNHGHGATSYQNVDMENFGSVPIPKDLQVDDGNEYRHSRYIYRDVDEIRDSTSLDLHNYADDYVTVNHVIDATEDPYIFDGHLDEPDHVENAESDLSPQHYDIRDYEHYENGADYEYH